MGRNVPPNTPTADLDHERYLEHSVDLVARVRAAKEAAQREMETFGKVSEYEIRKIYGKKTSLSSETPDQRDEPHRSSVADRKPKSRLSQSPTKEITPEAQGSFEFPAEGTMAAPEEAEES